MGFLINMTPHWGRKEEEELASKQFGPHWICWLHFHRLLTAPGIDLTKTRSEKMGEADEKALKELSSFIIEAIIIPVLAVFGIAGNILITHWEPIRHRNFLFPWKGKRSTQSYMIQLLSSLQRRGRKCGQWKHKNMHRRWSIKAK